MISVRALRRRYGDAAAARDGAGADGGVAHEVRDEGAGGCAPASRYFEYGGCVCCVVLHTGLYLLRYYWYGKLNTGIEVLGHFEYHCVCQWYLLRSIEYQRGIRGICGVTLNTGLVLPCICCVRSHARLVLRVHCEARRPQAVVGETDNEFRA